MVPPMPLSDLQIRKAKQRDKPYKVADGLGLFLQINPSGSKLWRMKYRFLGKEKLLALGAYPLISLADARKKEIGHANRSRMELTHRFKSNWTA